MYGPVRVDPKSFGTSRVTSGSNETSQSSVLRSLVPESFLRGAWLAYYGRYI